MNQEDADRLGLRAENAVEFAVCGTTYRVSFRIRPDLSCGPRRSIRGNRTVAGSPTSSLEQDRACLMTSSHPIAALIGVLVVALGIASGLIWVERRLLALWQDRYGPNRVGPFGLLQVVADMIKIFAKEDWVPPFADKPVFVVAPAIIMVTVLMSFAVVPFAPGIIVGRPEYRAAVLPGHVVAWRSTASCWRAGRPTTSMRCWAACAPRRRCSATRSSWACR